MDLVNSILVVVTAFTLLACNLGVAKNTGSTLPSELAKSNTVPRSHEAVFANTYINIDGLANDSAWANTRYLSDFVDITKDKKPTLNTKVKVLFDDVNFYVFAELEDNHLWAKLSKKDSRLYKENNFELFIDPDNDGKNYLELEINVLNTIFDLRLNKPFKKGGTADSNYDIEGLKTAVFPKGTINNSSDLDNGWCIELSIPLKTILELSRNKEKSSMSHTSWRVQFARVFWDTNIQNNKYVKQRIDGKLIPENNWVWSPQKSIDNHIPQDWGIINFKK